MLKGIKKWLFKKVIRELKDLLPELLEEARETFKFSANTVGIENGKKVVRFKFEIFGITLFEEDLKL